LLLPLLIVSGALIFSVRDPDPDSRAMLSFLVPVPNSVR
jgi:hypothetical protein